DEHDETTVADLRYEVMYFLHLDDGRIGEFKKDWGEIGDSIVVVGGDGLWNCHVHTNDIGAAVEVALDLGGRPRQIRVTDLFEEVADEHRLREASMAPSGSDPVVSVLPAVTCAVVAVASGSGLAALFEALGVQRVVTGGQTLNPSTAELLEAVAGCNASQVVVLPNNKNIIPVADQLAALTDTTVVVVPTMSMPEALAALIVYDADATAADNAAVMAAAASAVAVGEVTRAVRATTTPAGPVGDGDYMGIAGGATPDGVKGIVAVSQTVDGAAIALLERIAGPAAEILTVVEGLDASADTTDAIRRWAAEHRPGLQVEVHAGAQPLYPYLFGVE
ncbi:MAG: hypothetical protein ACKOYG_06985, partial [Ilumatobacteraceae bacterium]